MNKQEYLEKLEGLLKHKLSRSEIDDIMRDYAEYFEEGRRQSKQDSEISAKLGDPEIVAQELIEESRQENEYHTEEKTKTSGVKNWWDKNVTPRMNREKIEKESEQKIEENGEQTEKTEVQRRPNIFTRAWVKVKNLWVNRKKSPRKTGEGMFLRSVHAFWRGVHWCIFLMMGAVLMMGAAGVTGMLLFVSGIFLFLLAMVFLVAILMDCVAVLGIILSGFGFAFFEHMGLAILTTSIAGFGLFTLLSLLCVKFFKSSCGEIKGIAGWSGKLWMRIFHKVESWLVQQEEVSDLQSQEKEEQEPQQNEEISLQPSLPSICETEE